MPDGGAAAEGTVQAVELALADVAIDGWDIVVEHVDSDADGEAGAVVSDISADDEVIAVVGGLTMSAVRAAQAPLDRATIPFISPADAEPEHTRGADPSAPQRPYASYFRTTVPDRNPYATAAEYAVFGLQASRIVVVSDDRPDEAGEMVREVRRLGVEATIESADELTSVVGDVDDDETIAFYVAAGADVAIDVVSELDDAGVAADVIGGDGLNSDEFLADLGQTSRQVATVLAPTLPPTADVPVPGLAAPGPFGAAAFDAGTVLARTLERCLPPVSGGARSARVGCLSELGAVSTDGVTGPLSFDEYGERPGARPYIVVGTEGRWHTLGS